MQTDVIEEARRQAEICNACRYCEGYCSVFPSLHENRALADGDITQLANLCHNCRGCYYACQYIAPHEFNLNLPKALADVRQDSWEKFACPTLIANQFQKNGVFIAVATILGFALLFTAASLSGDSSGQGFYSAMSHNVMVWLFAPAFVFPLVSIGISLRRYWRATGGTRLKIRHIKGAFGQATTMSNLSGGHGQGCNFEDEDRYSQARRMAHHLVFYGFLLCFASTGAGTVLHYGYGLHAPYSIWSLPKLLGIPGGLMLTFGSLWMVSLKCRADTAPEAANARGGEIAFILQLGFVAFSGLMLYALGATAFMPTLLALHLGAVFSFFLLMPYTKMAHGFYRFAALMRDAQRGQ